MPHTAIKRRTRTHAQTMRREPTDAERKLWQILRALRKSHGLHFRRQAPIGPFIADFACHHCKLVIEIDGGQHESLRRAHDEERSNWLSSQGYSVLRFWNNDVLESPVMIAELIVQAADPTPDPSPQGGGEKRRASRRGQR